MSARGAAAWVGRRARSSVRPSSAAVARRGAPVATSVPRRANPMRRPAAVGARTGSPVSIAAPGLVPPSVLATLDDAANTLAIGALLAVVAVTLLVLAWRLAVGGERGWPAAFGVLGGCVGVVAFVVLLFGSWIADCAPDAYECPV